MQKMPMLLLTFICLVLWAEGIIFAEDVRTESGAPVVTADIQAGIERHIAEQTRAGDGYFILPYENTDLKLKLVRVHTEYLATLGPQRHFACVDMAGTDGKMYDVDFFLTGGPESMSVTETTVHKVNGQPLYVWQQNPDKTWVRVPVEGAPPQLLGVLHGTDRFIFTYLTEIPQIKETARMWLPVPSTDGYQTVQIVSMDIPEDPEIIVDSAHGNRVMFIELSPEDSGKTISLRYAVTRYEKSPYDAQSDDVSVYLESESMVPSDTGFGEIARNVIEGKDGTLRQARALYDHVIDRMSYVKFGKGWGKGDAVFACNAGTGNCTDFHSYFVALARSVGIPARFAIGASIPSERNAGRIDGYHCWAEFYAEGKWWPVDISEADKCSALSTYYFGHHPANRIELSRGRDLVVEPAPASEKINFLAYPILEVDGQAVKADIVFAFKRNTEK